MSAWLYVVVPVYNEEENLPRLLSSIGSLEERLAPELGVRLLLVDDGSSDGTAALARSHRARPELRMLTHETNQGPGAAFGSAFEYLHSVLSEGDWVATMEGDNTSSIETLLHMLTRRKEGYDAVLASPYAYGGGFSQVQAHRLLLSHLANGAVKVVFGIHGLHTFSSFFRIYSAQLLRKLQAEYGPRVLTTSGFECMVELLAKMIRVEARISEVEQIVDWGKRRGLRKMRIGRTAAGYLHLFLRRGRLAVPVPYAR